MARFRPPNPVRVYMAGCVGAAVTLAACGGTSQETIPTSSSAATAAIVSTPTSAEAGAPAVTAPDSSAPVAAALVYDANARYISCGFGLPFTSADVERPAIDLAADNEVMAALRQIGQSSGMWATGQLRIVAHNEIGATILEEYNDVPWAFVWNLRYNNGVLAYTNHGGCRLTGYHNGLTGSSFVLDPSHTATPESTEIAVLVYEVDCASGYVATGRVRQPYIEYSDDTVDILITVAPAAGGQTCQGNPPTPYIVTLTQPLGDRVIRDASIEPVARAAQRSEPSPL